MSPAVVSETTTFTGTDSLTLRLAGTEDYTLGGITVEDSNSSDTVASSLTLSFDFTDIPSASDINTYPTLTSALTASNVQILLDLNMFNDIAGGEYTLLNGNLNVANYSLTNNLNGRLHLNSETSGKLVLVVDTDNRLYWRSNGTTRNWNTTESNWHKEGLSALTAFTTNSDVVFDSTGITNGSSASSRETVTLTENVTVGNVSVKDSTAHYEVTGSTTLTGTSLVVGLGGDLKLSTTSASFTNGVRVDNAKLEVNKTTLTANVSITNGASFTLSNSATLTGDLSVTDGTVSVNNSSISGNITTQGSGTATLNSLTLTGEITGATGGRIIAGTYNGTSTTYSAATLSGTLNWGGETGSSLSLTSSSLYLDGAVNLTELSVGTGTTVTVWNSTGTSGTEKTLGTVKLGNNAVFQTNDRAEVTAATHIETLQLEGNTATLQDVHHSGSFTVNTLKLGEGVNSSNLILKKNAASTWSTIFELGNATAEAGNFVGTITLNEANGGG
ncbi:MAG: hypothetical protein IJY80_03040, partial [Opitutales bacterium]|nr:hypothetical protein [Opitutales bacterium]